MTTNAIAIAQEGMTHDQIVGERVHMLMFRKRMSQTALGSKLGLTQSGVSVKLRGERKWSLDDLYAVADALDTTVPVILGFESPSGDTDPKTSPSDYKPVVSLADYRRSALVA